MFDNLPSLSEVVTGVKDVVGGFLGLQQSVNDVSFERQRQQLQMLQGQTAIDVARANVATNGEIAKLQAQTALKKAQAEASSGNLSDSLAQTIANINTKLGAPNSGSNVMLWLTVAGVAIAWMTYVRR